MFDYITRENKAEFAGLFPQESLSGGQTKQDIETFLRKLSTETIPRKFYRKILSWLAREMEISQGIIYEIVNEEGRSYLKYSAGFACQDPENVPELEIGEGFPGQVAKDGKLINLTNFPEDYLKVESGLGSSPPRSILIFPVLHQMQVLAVIEIASFHLFTEKEERLANSIATGIGKQLHQIISHA